jgi:exonuclease VII large subunit
VSERRILDTDTELLKARIRTKLSEAHSSVEKAVIVLKENDPRNIFSKGYAAVTDMNGNIVPDVKGIRQGDAYSIKMKDGSFTATVTEVFVKSSAEH